MQVTTPGPFFKFTGVSGEGGGRGTLENKGEAPVKTRLSDNGSSRTFRGEILNRIISERKILFDVGAFSDRAKG